MRNPMSGPSQPSSLSQDSRPGEWSPRQNAGRLAWLSAPFRLITPRIIEQPGTPLRERDVLRRGQINALVIVLMLLEGTVTLVSELRAPSGLAIFLGIGLVLLVGAAVLNRAGYVSTAAIAAILVILMAISLGVFGDVQQHQGFSWFDVARLMALALPTFIGGIVLRPAISWIPFVLSAAAIVAITLTSPLAPDLVPVAAARLGASTTGPGLLAPVMIFPIILNFGAYLLSLVSTVTSLRTLRAFYEQSGLAEANAAYARQLQAYSEALEQGDAIMRDSLARIAQGDWNVRVRHLPPGHPRYAMVSLYAQVLQRVARVRSDMEATTTMGQKAQAAWERVYHHFADLTERMRRTLASGTFAWGSRSLDDAALIAQVDTGYTAADAALRTLQAYLVSCQNMREAEAAKVVRVIADIALKGDTRQRIPAAAGEMRDVARAVNFLLDRMYGPGQAQPASAYSTAPGGYSPASPSSQPPSAFQAPYGSNPGPSSGTGSGPGSVYTDSGSTGFDSTYGR